MKFHDAIKPGKMKNGEVFKFKNAFFGSVMKMGPNYYDESDTSNRIYINDECLGEDGEIIREEPEVLTFQEIFNNHGGPVWDTDRWTVRNIENCICTADKNGQNKEWKRLKKLIDNFASKTEILKNLTPPWELEEN